MNNNFAQIISKDEIKELPLHKFPGTTYIIDSCKDLSDICKYLSRQPLLGFDTETRPSFKKGVQHQVALLQFATRDYAFLFRLYKMGLPKEIVNILKNGNIIKAGVAINDDIKTLQKLQDFTPGGFLELQKYVKQFGIESNGLKKLTAIVLNFRISKSQRLTNWENPELTQSQIDYAATDAWVCYEIYHRLSRLE